MKRISFTGVMMMSSLFFAYLLISSCVSKEYDLSGDNLNLEVTPFQEGISIPLGNVDTLRMKDVLKDLDEDFLNVGENGAYSGSFKDSFDMSDKLAEVKDMLKIDDIVVSEDFLFELNDVDVSDVKVDAVDFEFEYMFSDITSMPELRIPDVSESFGFSAGIGRYVPDVSELNLDLPEIHMEDHFISVSDELQIPAAMINDTPVSLEGDLLKNHLSSSVSFDWTESVDVNISLPAGVKSVNEIHLMEGSAIKVTMELRNSFLLSGSIVPEIDIDLHNIFHLDSSHNGDIAHLADDFVLSEKNGYKQTAIYVIESLSITDQDWSREGADSPYELSKAFDVPASGTVICQDLMTTTRLLSNTRSIDIYLNLEFVNLGIEDIEMEVDPVNLSQNEEFVISVDNISVPEEIEAIENVTFSSTSGIDVEVSIDALDKIRGLDAEIETLTLTFPESLSVSGADADNKLVFNDVDLAEKFSRHVRIQGIDLPEPVNGKINFSEKMLVDVTASAGGVLHTSDLLTVASDDINIAVNVASVLEVDDFEVKLSEMEFEMDLAPETIKVEIPEDIADLDEIVIHPEGNPALEVELSLPDVGFDLIPSEDGFAISFPEIFAFKNVPESYNYDLKTNSVTFTGSLPSMITLPIDRIILRPEIDEADGKYYAGGEVAISGGVAVAPTVMDKAAVEKIVSEGVSVSVVAHVPELVPSTINVDSYETTIEEEITITLLNNEDIPAELISLNVVELDDVYLNISLDASSLPDLGSAEFSLDVEVDLPDMVKINESHLNSNGNVVLKGKMDKDGKIVIPAIKIDALDLAGVDFRAEGGLSDVIFINGSAKIENAALDVDQWLGKDLNLGFTAEIKDIKVSKVTGRVDYKVEPVVETVDMSQLTGALSGEGMDAVLDFHRAHIILEVATNLGLPVDAQVVILPYYDGRADESKAIKASLTLDPVEDSSKPEVTKYWISGKSDKCPSGYRFVEADITELLKNIPEKLEIRLEAGTDPDRDCVLEPNVDYTFKADYLFELPMEFGEEFEISYRETVPDMPAILSSLLSKGSLVRIGGEIFNTLPLAFDLKINFLDAAGQVVPLSEGCGIQTIASCNLDGSVSKTELKMDISLPSSSFGREIKSLELLFNANSGDAVGVPVTEDAGMYATLHLVLPEGITVDLDELMSEIE